MPWEELRNAWFAPQYTLTFLKETTFYLSVRGRTWWSPPQREGKIPENWHLNKDLEWTKRILTLAFTAFIQKRKMYSHCWSSPGAALLFTFFQKKLWRRELKVLNLHSPYRNATPNNGGNTKSHTEQLTFCLLRNRQFHIPCSVEWEHFNTAECFDGDFWLWFPIVLIAKISQDKWEQLPSSSVSCSLRPQWGSCSKQVSGFLC